MTHDFKKGDPVILEDGKQGIIHSIVVCIAEVEINKHYKYVDVRTLKHPNMFPPWTNEKESRAGEAVAELETLPDWTASNPWVDYHPSDPWPDKPNGQAKYDNIMADGCDPEPLLSCDETGMTLGWRCMSGCKADDGSEVEILREKP